MVAARKGIPRGLYISLMCGRVIQSPGPVRYAMVDGLDVRDSRPWSAYDGEWIRLRQSRGRRVSVPVTSCLRRVLESAPRLGPIILTGPRGRPWTAGAFRNAWIKAVRAAGVTDGLHFHDLRGTAITRLAEAGCRNAEIATITGHSLSYVGAILDRYLARTDQLAVAAIARLERARS